MRRTALARKRMRIIIETVDDLLPHVKGGRQHKALLKVRNEAEAKLDALAEH